MTPANANRADADAEVAITIDCAGETLVGVVHRAAGGAQAHARHGVVVVVGGPQYRAGSHRHFVALARDLAAAGFAVLRFDARGMGDSTGELRHFEHLAPDVGAAVDALQRHVPTVRQVVLWGLCDGASAALLYLHERADPRIAGLCLLNPWVRSEVGLARTQVKHYYGQRLLQPAFWRKLLAGGIGLGALRGLVANVRLSRRQPEAAGVAPFQARMAAAWERFPGAILLALSGNDYTAREFDEFTAADPAWQQRLQRVNVSRHALPQADHTLGEPADQQRMNSITIGWLATLAGAQHNPGSARQARHGPDPDLDEPARIDVEPAAGPRAAG